jgi:hypothetical protein
MQVIRRRWKRIIAFAALLVLALFPIPVLPLWGVNINENAMIGIVIITIIISIPMLLLAIFMK